jgi:hypothetical protein
VENLLNKLKELKVKYFFGKIKRTTDAMIKEFCRVIGNYEFIREVDMTKPRNIYAMAMDSITKTIIERISETVRER